MVVSPLVSICIPTYNRERIIAHTIESVIKQSYQNIEIVISDNCSTDKTFEIIKNYSMKDKRIKPLQMKENMGPVANWKNCNDNANGEFIKFLWSDDYIDNDFIEKTMNLFKEDIGFVYTPVKWYDVKTMKVNNDNIGFTLLSKTSSSINLFIEALIVRGTAPVSGSCAIFRKSIINDLFHANIKNTLGLDYRVNGAGFDALMFLYGIKDYKKFAYVNDIYTYYGVDSDGITVRDGQILTPYYFSVFYDFLKKFKSDRKLVSKLNTKILFYRMFFATDNETKTLLSKLEFKITEKKNYIYFIELIFKEFFLKKTKHVIIRITKKVLHK